jgi:DNA-binding response OmpR family regulator
MILVIDDDRDSTHIVATILRSAGFEVMVATSGKDGVERAVVTRPQLIVMDIAMPELDGIEALKRLRAAPETEKIYVVLLSAKTADEDVIAGYAAGADYYLAKPFTTKQLLYGVRRVLDKSP